MYSRKHNLPTRLKLAEYATVLNKNTITESPHPHLQILANEYRKLEGMFVIELLH